MNRLIKCINFQLRSMLKSTVLFLGGYFLVSLALLLLFLGLRGSNSNGDFNSGFFIGGAIFSFIYVIANYRGMFNYMLMFGNTRKNIFLSNAISVVIMSVLLAAVSILSELIEDISSNILHFRDPVNILGLMYNGLNKATEFLWFTAFFIVICSFSMLYSSLAYKLGKVFVTVFWIAFGLSWMVIPGLAGLSGMTAFINMLKTYFSVGVPNGILLAPVNFIITAIVFGLSAFLISRRQSQSA